MSASVESSLIGKNFTERLTCVICGGTLAIPVVPLEPEGDVVALPALGTRLATRAVHLTIVPDRRS